MILSRAIEALGPDFYDPVRPARFPLERLRHRDGAAAAAIGVDGLDEGAWLARFARFEPFDGGLPEPLALRYHGHQFRQYNPDIGDGRGFLYAQCRDGAGRLLDLGTKGSGTTPFSRAGDGRLTLKGAVREVLAPGQLAALGVPVSRALSVVETGERLTRGDEPSPARSAVLVRLQHGHIRIGTFERLAYRGEAHNVARLVGYVRRELQGVDDEDAVAMLERTARDCAAACAALMAAGFVHGVLNSDNINVTGEVFDFGPWRFLPRWDPGFTAAYFDHGGLYAYARQPEAYAWNLLQLARSLRLVADAEALLPALQAFGPAYESALSAAMLRRLGVTARGEADDLAVLRAFELAAAGSEAGIDRIWFDWRGGRARRGVYDGVAWDALREALGGYAAAPGALAHPYWDGAAPETMLIDEVEAIWAAIAERDDWAPFGAKLERVAEMGLAHRV